jgi:hypothetical protein
MANNEYIKKLIQADLGNAQDNLYRAQAAARECDPSKEWRQSGQTLQSIIDGYQAWADQAQAALDALSGEVA